MSESLNNITLAIINLLDLAPTQKTTLQDIISRALFVRPQTVSKAVARLTKSGHISCNTEKHSLRSLILTPKGKSLLRVYETIR